MSKRIILKQKDGDQILVDEFPYQIGSFDQFCQLTLEEKDIAPIHCVIDIDNDRLTVQEMNTLLGIDVNEEKIENGRKVEIDDSDIIKIGDNEFTVITELPLFTESEMNSYNQTYKAIKNANSGEAIKDDASKLIQQLWMKIKEVNSLVTINSESVPINKAINGYLKDTFKDDLPKIKPSSEAINIRSKFKQNRTPLLNINKERNVNLNRESNNDYGIKNNGFRVRNRRRFTDEMDEATVSLSGIQNRDIMPPIMDRNSESSFNNDENSSSVTHPILKEEQVVPCLELREINAPYTKIIIEKTPCRIGIADSLCEIVLNRKGISRVHATILRNDQNTGFLIRDNNSTNGTYLNGKRIINSEAELHRGDHVKLYNYEFRVMKSE